MPITDEPCTCGLLKIDATLLLLFALTVVSPTFILPLIYKMFMDSRQFNAEMDDILGAYDTVPFQSMLKALLMKYHLLEDVLTNRYDRKKPTKVDTQSDMRFAERNFGRLVESAVEFCDSSDPLALKLKNSIRDRYGLAFTGELSR